MRLHKVYPEYKGRVHLRECPFPLELFGGEPAPRDILEQEWWLAAIQEPAAQFNPFKGDDWPATTLPAFQAAWCISQMEPEQALDFDLRIRRAFFAEGRNIGKRETMLDLAREASLDVPSFTRLLDSNESRDSVLAEAQMGKVRFRVRGTPTLMLSDGTRLRLPIAFPHLRVRKVVSVDPLPCHSENCLDETRALFEQALNHQKISAPPKRPGHPVPGLTGPWLQFDLAAETEKLRHEHTWKTRSRNSITLAKYEDLRVVLIAMKSASRMESHKTEGRISIQALTGRLRLHLPNQTVEVPAGHLLTLERALPHDVEALEESSFLLVISLTKGA